MSQPKLLPQTKPAAKILKKKAQPKKNGTPYDDAFHTLLKACTPLILPVINEMFGEHYTGEEQITFLSERFQMNQKSGESRKRITDSTFTVSGAVSKHYLLEAQSTVDNSMVVRIFEYSTLAALDTGELTGDTLHVTIPQCGILFFRSNSNTPDRMHINIDTPGGDLTFDVQVLKTQQYTIDEIFEKNLLMLIPFHIFSHEKELMEYNTKEEKLRELETEYAAVIDRLKNLKEDGQLTEYQHRMLLDMSRTVLINLAADYDKIKEGVGEIMGGNFIETEASRIYHEGEKRGEARGEARGEERKSRRTALRLYARGETFSEIADILEVDIVQVQQWFRSNSATKL